MTDIERSWLDVDLSAILAGSYEPPKPVVGQRSDGVGLFYPGKLHSVASESEGGKTWLALAATFDEIKAGNHCLYIDFEDSEEGIVGRLLSFGLPADVIAKQFHYKRPTQPINSEVHLSDLKDTLAQYEPTLAVIDGMTEALTLHGLKVNDNNDIVAFSEMLPRKLSRAGIATVVLDHVVKSADSRGRYAIGGVHKLNGLDGAAYLLEPRDPFGVNERGRSTILIAKDRPGQLRKHGLRRKDGLHYFGDLIVESKTDSDAEFEIRPAVKQSGPFRPTHVMRKISDVYEGSDVPLSQKTVLAIVRGDQSTARLAHALLRAGGYLTDRTPHELLKPFREDELADDLDDDDESV